MGHCCSLGLRWPASRPGLACSCLVVTSSRPGCSPNGWQQLPVAAPSGQQHLPRVPDGRLLTTSSRSCRAHPGRTVAWLSALGWPRLPPTPIASSARFGCPGAGPSSSADVQPMSAICFYAASCSSYCYSGRCTTMTTSSSCSPPHRGGFHYPCG